MAPATMADRLWSEQQAVLEYGAFGVAWPWFSLLPRGQGQPVLVLPGFAGSDRSTAPLRAVLRNLGYDARGWALGRNEGPRPEVLEGMARRLAQIQDAAGQPVNL